MRGFVFCEFALPDDPQLDDFDSGDTEVNAYVRSCRWFNAEKGQTAPPTYLFREDKNGPLVGFATVSVGNVELPDDQSATRAKYLKIFALGVNQQYHGRKCGLAPDKSYAAAIIAQLQDFALSKPGCVGFYLWVRSNNARAIRFYEKMGFEADRGGPMRRDEGAPHLTMRKHLV